MSSVRLRALDSAAADEEMGLRGGVSIAETKQPTRLKQQSGWLAPPTIAVCALMLLFLYSFAMCLQPPRFDDSSDYVSDFDASKAIATLSRLVTLGPRTVGAKSNDVECVKMLREMLNGIREGAQHDVLMEVEEQYPSGLFDHTQFLDGFTSAYQNVSNVVVRLASRGAPTSGVGSVLMNAHFDTGPGAVGAADDLAGVAVMIEIARALTRPGVSLARPVVLLFNGAEESHQLAAHGFMTQHRWAKDLRAVINLEAIGAGGREFLFQCNSLHVAQLYAQHTPFPFGSVVGQELFDALIAKTAATDFRTFVEYGPPGLVGVDFAYVDNGFVYHTSFDTLENTPAATLHHTGKNALALLHGMVNDAELHLPRHPDDAKGVFFDACGFFMVTYTASTMYALHSLLGVGAVLWPLWRCAMSVPELVAAVAHQAIGCILGIVAAAALGLVLYIVAPMRWYAAGEWLAVVLYAPLGLGVQASWMGRRVALSTPGKLHPAREACVGGVGMFAVLTLGLTVLGVRTSYVGVWWMVWATAAAEMLPRHHDPSDLKSPRNTEEGGSAGQGRAWVGWGVFMVPCAVLWGRLCSLALSMLTPLLGKSGTLLPADPILAAAIAGLAVLSGTLIVAPWLTVDKSRMVFRRAAMVCIVAVVCVLPLPAYTVERPKRLHVQHVRKSQDGAYKGSGLMVTAFDSQALHPLQTHRVPRLDGRHLIECDHDSGACLMDYPYYFPIAKYLRTSWWLPVDPPPLPPERRLMVAQEYRYDFVMGACEVMLTVRGPAQLHFVLDDHDHGERLRSWSLGAVVPPVRDDGVYYAMLTTGGPGDGEQGACSPELCTWEVQFSLHGPEPAKVSLGAHYLDIVDTQPMRDFYKEIPAWSKGAEWAKFVSAVETLTVAPGDCRGAEWQKQRQADRQPDL